MEYIKIFSATLPPEYALSSLEEPTTAFCWRNDAIVPEEIWPA